MGKSGYFFIKNYTNRHLKLTQGIGNMYQLDHKFGDFKISALTEANVRIEMTGGGIFGTDGDSQGNVNYTIDGIENSDIHINISWMSTYVNFSNITGVAPGYWFGFKPNDSVGFTLREATTKPGWFKLSGYTAKDDIKYPFSEEPQ